MTCDIREMNPYESPEEKMFKDIEVMEASGKSSGKIPCNKTSSPQPVRFSYEPCPAYDIPRNMIVCPVCRTLDEVVPLRFGDFRCDRCNIKFSIKTIGE